jgi:hypothetical protein
MKPMMAKPIAVAIAIFWNSKAQKTWHFNFTIPLLLVHLKWEILLKTKRREHGKTVLPFRSGFVHLLTKRRESLAN